MILKCANLIFLHLLLVRKPECPYNDRTILADLARFFFFFFFFFFFCVFLVLFLIFLIIFIIFLLSRSRCDIKVSFVISQEPRT